jgi:hypothetical protein
VRGPGKRLCCLTLTKIQDAVSLLDCLTHSPGSGCRSKTGPRKSANKTIGGLALSACLLQESTYKSGKRQPKEVIWYLPESRPNDLVHSWVWCSIEGSGQKREEGERG